MTSGFLAIPERKGPRPPAVELERAGLRRLVALVLRGAHGTCAAAASQAEGLRQRVACRRRRRHQAAEDCAMGLPWPPPPPPLPLGQGVLRQISLTAWQSADAQVHDACSERVFKTAAASQAADARADGRPCRAANHKADYTANC
jgi:hypothetical protein